MTPDVRRLIGFYNSPLGEVVGAVLSETVADLAGDLRERRVMGLGYAIPCLAGMAGAPERVMAFMPERQGAVAWPATGLSRTVLVDPLDLPLTDSAIDLTIALHSFEHIADAEELMRELWRVSAPNARLVIVVPRRAGLWAHLDNTPFGAGHPYSRSQLERLLRDHSFVPERWAYRLHMPPISARPLLGWARAIERIGRPLGPFGAGIMCVLARKELFPAVPRRKRLERFVRVPAMAPQAAMNLPRDI
ncbi:Methyltransferase domain-containing protein [Devosia enhydra]|uniref:Methyltransferase domain-containing protein n=1 Tax=Devosia enhydra TaxID=665118 RepID=A0A1K2I093_9HYPH|nr:methyltransferase domain-containing protein [Devosia enhydra]SFZ85745.1 Methyltransferase domain-containing protein [Devosia enhydra]